MKPRSAKSGSAPGKHGAIELARGVHWIGALDPQLRHFDVVLNTERGTSYNAYLVRGDNGVALIDTVKAEFAEEYFRRLESVARYDEIRTIVLNHLEPDHTGALPELLRRSSKAKVYLSARAKPMLKGLSNVAADVIPVKTGDSLDLGGRALSFLTTPWLHWPDTQCSWLADSGILFSGDAFGSHVCDARLFNDLIDDFNPEFEYYYAQLMRPFRSHVRGALDVIEPLPVQVLAPAHGPVLRSGPEAYVRRYRQLSGASRAGNVTKMLRVFYVSAYGNTKAMADVVAAGAKSQGVAVSLHDLEQTDSATFADLVEDADGIAVGSPTFNGDAVKPVWQLLSSLNTVELRGKWGAVFGSYGWSGEAVPLVEERLRGLKFRLPLAGVRARLIPTPDELAECRGLGVDLARYLTGQAEPRVVDLSKSA